MRPEDMIGALDQQRPEVDIAGLGDAELRVVVPRLAASRPQAEVTAHIATSLEAFLAAQCQDIRQCRELADAIVSESSTGELRIGSEVAENPVLRGFAGMTLRYYREADISFLVRDKVTEQAPPSFVRLRLHSVRAINVDVGAKLHRKLPPIRTTRNSSYTKSHLAGVLDSEAISARRWNEFIAKWYTYPD